MKKIMRRRNKVAGYLKFKIWQNKSSDTPVSEACDKYEVGKTNPAKTRVREENVESKSDSETKL